jgi:hypothetical protein
VLGAGLEPACLSAYAPQTYVSAIPPPERFWKLEDGRWEIESRKRFCRAKVLSFKFLGFPSSPRLWTASRVQGSARCLTLEVRPSVLSVLFMIVLSQFFSVMGY